MSPWRQDLFCPGHISEPGAVSGAWLTSLIIVFDCFVDAISPAPFEKAYHLYQLPSSKMGAGAGSWGDQMGTPSTRLASPVNSGDEGPTTHALHTPPRSFTEEIPSGKFISRRHRQMSISESRGCGRTLHSFWTSPKGLIMTIISFRLWNTHYMSITELNLHMCDLI